NESWTLKLQIELKMGGGVAISLSSGAVCGGATVISEEFLTSQADQQIFAPQSIEVHMRYLKRNSHADDIAFDKEKLNRQNLHELEYVIVAGGTGLGAYGRR
ncbi:hypothetical protein FIBSPDRAFT_905321, partial [Athelia psychrophila]